jgi:pseudouridine-5'-phosphate glycosidase/pseudouridine kinase
MLLAMRAANTPGNQWAMEKSDPKSHRQIIARGRTAVFVLKHFPAMLLDSSAVINVTGAGDSLVGSILASLASNSEAMQDVGSVTRMVNRAQQAAALTLRSDMAVSPLLDTLDS